MKEKHFHPCRAEGDLPEGRRRTEMSNKRGHVIKKKDVVEVHTRLRKNDLAALYSKLKNTI